MSSASAIFPFDPESENWWSRESSKLAKRLCDSMREMTNIEFGGLVILEAILLVQQGSCQALLPSFY